MRNSEQRAEFKCGPQELDQQAKALCNIRDVKSGTRLGFRSGHFRSGKIGYRSFQVDLTFRLESGRVQVRFRSTTGRVQNMSGSKQVGFKTGRVQNKSGKIGSRVGFGCYSNRSDSVPGQHQSVTDRVRVIAASGQTRF
ncbi:hypothetical protein GQ457_04G008610 [Hibiscus cannabinus]